MLCTLAALIAASPAHASPFPVEIETTSLLRRPSAVDAPPMALLLLRASGTSDRPASIRVETTGGNTLFQSEPKNWQAGQVHRVHLPMPTGADSQTVVVTVTRGAKADAKTVRVWRPDPDWTMHFSPGFHFDPVWWNTQAHYTETGYRMGDSVGPGLTLVDEYLRKCREDPDYKVALHESSYLKTLLEARPQKAPELLERIKQGRCDIVGGTYNEPSTTLVSAEASARNAIYGAIFQREILGGRGDIAWQLDVFGHDPSFPSILSRAGHTGATFARGPFHQWGAPRDQVNFPSEFLWMAPDGRSVLTHYMSGHYGYAYGALAAGTNSASPDRHRWETIVEEMFEDLKRPALTHHVLLPLHMDFIRPLENLGEVVRHWNETYISPRAEISTPADFFGAVRAEIEDRSLVVPVITRDMNPIYTGCPVSFADVKTANRACEVALRDAEIMATIASLEGAPYPSLGIDRAWRQLLYTSHHDAVTGSMSDQVYIDLLYSYRDAQSIASEIRDEALSYLTSRIAPPEPAKPSQAVWNTLASPRKTGGGHNVPAVGYVCVDAGDKAAASTTVAGHKLENEHLVVAIDLDKGGTIASIVDKRTGREILRGPGNDIVLLDEYATMPGQGEMPWHLAPTGKRRSSTGTKARLIEPGQPNRITIEAEYHEFTKLVTFALSPGSVSLDIETAIINWRGTNKLLRAEFPVDLPGARPVFQTASAVIGRPFARDVDALEDPWTLDQTCWQWVDLGTTATLEVVDGETVIHRQALGVGEIIYADGASDDTKRRANGLAEALVKCGLTTTITSSGQRRYGDLAHDSNVPDFRVWIGPPDHAGTGMPPREVDGSPATLSVVEDQHGLLMIIAPNAAALVRLHRQLGEERSIRIAAKDAVIESTTIVEDYGVALVNRGPVSVHVSPDGTMGLNLLRSSTGWPAGVWIDRPQRRLPDGSAFETMHGTHKFMYSIVPHAGDYRRAKLSRIAQEINHPLAQGEIEPSGEKPAVVDTLPASASFVEIDRPQVLLMAMKPAGFPEARWRIPRADAVLEAPRQVALRLWNGGGEPVEAGVRLRHFAGTAFASNLLEERLAPLPVEDGVIKIKMGPHDARTILCDVTPRQARPDGSNLDPIADANSSSAYWLENLGEGVTGNGILSIAPEQRELRLVDGAATTRVRVVNNNPGDSVRVQLSIDAGPCLDVALERDELSVPAGGFAEVELKVARKACSDLRRSVITITANSTYPWPLLAGVWVVPEEEPGGSSGTQPAIEIVNVTPLVQAGQMPMVRLINHTDGPITGEAAWLCPEILWPALPWWRSTITVPAGGEAEAEAYLFGVADSFLMLRYTYAGKIAYGEPIAVTTDPGTVYLQAGVDRLRLREGRAAQVTLNAKSISGIDEKTELLLKAPEGWDVRELERTHTAYEVGAGLDVRFGVSAGGSVRQARLIGSGPGGARTDVTATVVPVQHARPKEPDVEVDGSFDEWSPSEFTEASGDRGRVRTAVRHGSGGFALAFEVFDQTFVQKHSGAAMWQGDSIQWGLSVEPSSTFGYQDTDFEFGAAKTPDGPMVWCWLAGPGGRTGLIRDAEFAIHVGEASTTYEVRLPSSVLPVRGLSPGTVLGFTYVANDNDGDGFAGATQWTGGISGGKDPSLWGDLILADE